MLQKVQSYLNVMIEDAGLKSIGKELNDHMMADLMRATYVVSKENPAIENAFDSIHNFMPKIVEMIKRTTEKSE